MVPTPLLPSTTSVATSMMFTQFNPRRSSHAALSVVLESYCPPANTTEFKPASMTRKVCGRGLSTDATPVVTLMWTTTLVLRTTVHFRPNHLVLLHARPHAVPVAPTSSQQSASRKRRAASRSRPNSKQKIQSHPTKHRRHRRQLTDTFVWHFCGSLLYHSVRSSSDQVGFHGRMTQSQSRCWHTRRL